MKLTIFLLFISVISAVAGKAYSQKKELTLNVKNSTVKEVLQKIEDQSEFYFMYSEKLVDVKRKVSVNIKDKKINEVLDELFTGTNVNYKVKDRFILLVTPEVSIGEKVLQQQKSLSGKVTDETGQPLPGVTVLIKGTTNGTITNMDGEYSISNIPENSILVFSFLGMETQEIALNGQSTMNVKMNTDYVSLDEVVAIGYGTTTKRKMVSSISTIETNEIKEAPYSNVMQGMAGRSAGLFTRESGGKYGSLPQISIRGGGEPLYVIDGIVSSKREFANTPSEDIETISILKDASATAVYGMNAADGIVLVNTKKGEEGKVKIAYSGNLSFQQPTILPEYGSAYEVRSHDNLAALYDGTPPYYDDEMLEHWRTGDDPINFPNYHPKDMLLRDFSKQNKHNVSLSGTSNSTKIFMSLDYFDQGTILNTNDWGEQRYSFRSNISHKMDKIGLTTTGNVSLQHRQVDDLISDGFYGHIFSQYYPGTKLYTPEGRLLDMGQNVMAEVLPESGYKKGRENLVVGRLELKWDIPWVEGLTFKTIGNVRYSNNFNKDWTANQRLQGQLYLWDETPSDMGYAQLQESTDMSYSYTLESHLNYLKTFAEKHTVELTGVYTQREGYSDNFWASRTKYISSAVDQLFAGSSEGKDNSGNGSEFGRIGYIGRVKYDFDAKYIIEASFRYDGNDNFPDGEKWGFFPAASLGWNIHKESFAEGLLSKISMTTLKLRASYGKTGTDAGVARFGYIPRYRLVNNAYYSGGAWSTGFREGNLVSNDISWYTRTSSNVGLDFGFIGGKISGTFDVFYSRTTGYLGSPSVDYTTPLGKGLPQIKTNSAHRRGGVEFSANYKANIGAVKLNVGGNVSYYDQLWETKFDEDSVALKNPYKRTTHQTDYLTVGYKNVGSNGMYNSMDEVLNNPRRLNANELMPGDLWFEDFNGDGIIDNNDQARIGKSSFPHIVYGMFLNAEYKGFNLNALFQGTSNRQLLKIEYPATWDIHLDSWTPDNKDAMYPRFTRNDRLNDGNNLQTSDFSIIDAWYVRLKSLSLSYDLKTKILRSWDFLNEFNIVLSGTNLFLISPATDYYIDPETANTANRNYPVNRTYNIGLRVTL